MTLPKGLAGVVVDQTKISSTKNAILTYAATGSKTWPVHRLKKSSTSCGTVDCLQPKTCTPSRERWSVT